LACLAGSTKHYTFGKYGLREIQHIETVRLGRFAHGPAVYLPSVKFGKAQRRRPERQKEKQKVRIRMALVVKRKLHRVARVITTSRARCILILALALKRVMKSGKKVNALVCLAIR
jgi:hypothetical protein